jgi:CRP/FNR family transcriptional regulator, cyclic AMP receptor protein
VSASPKPTGVVRVLDEDPDLGGALDHDAFSVARSTAVAPLVELRAGKWPLLRPAGEAVFGFLVLAGVIGSRIVISERAHLELLAPGDVIRPWVRLGPDASVPVRIDWEVLEYARLAILDRRFSYAVRDYPEVYEALAERLVLRSRRLNFLLAVNSVIGIEERIQLALWHFGERWGRVTSEGVYVSFPLTHKDNDGRESRYVERRSINPVSWSLKLGFDQAQLIEGHQRQLVCGGQDAVDADGNPQHPGDMAAQLELSLDTGGCPGRRRPDPRQRRPAQRVDDRFDELVRHWSKPGGPFREVRWSLCDQPARRHAAIHTTPPRNAGGNHG